MCNTNDEVTMYHQERKNTKKFKSELTIMLLKYGMQNEIMTVNEVPQWVLISQYLLQPSNFNRIPFHYNLGSNNCSQLRVLDTHHLQS